jgi:hypothetical protein
MRRTTAAAAVLAATAATPEARAQEPAEGCEREPSRESYPVAVVALRHGSVLGPTGGAGVIVPLMLAEPGRVDTHDGLLFRSEVGLGGMKIDLGAARYMFTHFPVGGVSLSLSWLHAWGSPRGGAEAGRDYVGAVGQLALLILSFELGGYSPVAATSNETGLLLSSVGVGF